MIDAMKYLAVSQSHPRVCYKGYTLSSFSDYPNLLFILSLYCLIKYDKTLYIDHLIAMILTIIYIHYLIIILTNFRFFFIYRDLKRLATVINTDTILQLKTNIDRRITIPLINAYDTVAYHLYE